MEELQNSVADTPWVVESNGSLRAIFGSGDNVIAATIIGSKFGTHDPIRLSVVRHGLVIHEAEHGDLASAMEDFIGVVGGSSSYGR